ncbi:lasso peptide biosynthesis PqqD family chaperone [Streptomyces sp. P1-3]|uniref:lasso peptide biosynthesis PqqD family chaperone n=1 Tax=Streptomyces sp. P1-3 TaxID=3421658 RepID=UPI003D361361
MTLRLRDGVSRADTDYGIALLDENSGEYWNLNPTGAQVLRTLLAGGTPDQAARELADAYDVDTESARRDVRELLVALRSSDLLEESHTGE